MAELLRLGGARLDRDDGSGAWVATAPDQALAFNLALSVRWEEADWRERLDSLRATFAADRRRTVILIADGLTRPPDLAERLLSRGWFVADRQRVLWTRRAAVVPHLDPALRLEAVTPPSAVAYEELERSIFGLPESAAATRRRALEAALEANEVRAYLLRLRGEPIGTARLTAADGLAALQGVGVVPAHRRRGFGTLITTIATRAGLATGNRFVWLSVGAEDAGATALYEGLGFRPAFSWQMIVEPAEPT